MEQELKNALDRLEERLEEKQCCNISTSSIVYSHASLDDYISISYRTSPKADHTSFHASGSIAECLTKIHSHISSIPAKADRERAEFYKLVTRAAEFGKSIDMDESLINPLEEMAKKLASNAVTFQPIGGAAVGRTAFAQDLNDEIPF